VAADPAASGAAGAPTTTPPSKGGRRFPWRALACALVGAIVAVGAFVVIDRGDSSGSSAKAPQSSPSSTAGPPTAAKIFKTIQPSLVLIQATLPGGQSSLGSGVIVDKQGAIMTADHVVHGATVIKVTFADGSSTTAQVDTSAPDRDTAILDPAAPPTVIVPAVIGGGVQIGDTTYSVGNPLGLVDSMTAGVVSGLDRSIQREDGGGDLGGLIQFDAAVNPGSSGGPLLNGQGQVVGIVTALANPSGQRFFVGIGFAVPIGSAGGGGRIPPA